MKLSDCGRWRETSASMKTVQISIISDISDMHAGPVVQTFEGKRSQLLADIKHMEFPRTECTVFLFVVNIEARASQLTKCERYRLEHS